MSFRATVFVFILLSFAVLAPVESAPTFRIHARHEGHDDTTSSSTVAAPPAATSSSAPDFVKQNALDAQKLNAKFKTIKETDSCQSAFGFVANRFIIYLFGGQMARWLASHPSLHNVSVENGS